MPGRAGEILKRNASSFLRQIAALLCTAWVATLPSVASATLTERDWKTAGDKLITFDSATNLEWLDVLVTRNRNVNFVSTQFGNGALYEGFRYATWAEFQTLTQDAGIAMTINYPNMRPVANLMAKVGFVNYEPTYPFRSSGGFTADLVPGAPNARYYAALVLNSGLSAGPTVTIDAMFDTTYRDGDTGNWLVRSIAAPVPEPHEYALFTAGLALVAAFARRRRIRRDERA